MSRTATSGRAPRETTLRPRADHCGVERDRAARCPWPTGLSAPLSAAAAPLIGGGELPFLALGLFSLAVLAPAPDRLGAASHGDERNNLLDQPPRSNPGPRTPSDRPLLKWRRDRNAEARRPCGPRASTPRLFHGYAIAVNAERERPREMESRAEWTRARPRSLS
jgi:hypothetical protein